MESIHEAFMPSSSRLGRDAQLDAPPMQVMAPMPLYPS